MSACTRTIAVVTGTRAEFGLLQPVMRAIEATDGLALQTIVTGTHLTRNTWCDIDDAGFVISARVPMQHGEDVGRAADVAALGYGITGIGAMLEHLAPDVVIVLGDRIEAFAAATAASVGGFHVAHIHGGDRAEGVADESLRHAISKMAHVHFAATEQSRERLIRMGESDRFVFNVGSPAADGLTDVSVADDSPELIVIQHPIGEEDSKEKQWMQDTLRAADGCSRLVLAPNDDPGSHGIREAIIDEHVMPVEHLPRDRFLELLCGAKAIVGNSSAGLIEAAILRKPCLNIGPRQAGREKPGNVIDCDYGQSNVATAIEKVMTLDLNEMHHPYGDGQSSDRIAETLAKIDLKSVLIRKQNTY